MDGRDAQKTDENTHLVGPRSPVYPFTALLLTVPRKLLPDTRAVEGWAEARCGEEDEWAGRVQQGRLQEDAPGMFTLPGLSFHGTLDDGLRARTDTNTRDRVGPKHDVGRTLNVRDTGRRTT